MKDIHGQLTWWLDIIAEYDHILECCKEPSNVAADYLTRISYEKKFEEGSDEGKHIGVLEDPNGDVYRYFEGLETDF